MTEIRQLAAAIATDSPLSPADRAMLADALARIANGESAGTAFDAARRSRRNAIFILIRARHFGHMETTVAARAIADAALRYALSTAWSIDRRRAECPHPAETLKADLWSALSLGQPPRWRQMFEILREANAAHPGCDCIDSD